MKALLILLLLTSTCQARLGVEVSLAIARSRIASQRIATTPKPTLWLYTADGSWCPPCSALHKSIAANERGIADLLKKFDYKVVHVTKTSGIRVPTFSCNRGKHSGPNVASLTKWLQGQLPKETKDE